MSHSVCRFTFDPAVPAEDIEATMVLAIMAVEALHRPLQARLDARHFFSADHRQCVIDVATPVGSDLAELFFGFAQREFDTDLFKVERVEESGAKPQQGPTT